MAVTKRTRALFVLVPTFTVFVLAFQNCAVELSEDTYGAASSCEPSFEELINFDTALTNFFQKTDVIGASKGCGTCHLSNSGNTAAATFPILPGTSDAEKKTNWCAASGKADDISSGFLTGGSHAGGIYQPADIQPLLDWAKTIK